MELHPARSGQPALSKPCNLCGCPQYRVLFHKFGFDIVACRQCGLQYLPWQMSAAELQEFYSDGYFTGQEDRHGYLDYEGDSALLMDNFRDKLSDIHLSPGRLLDIGAALGYFVQVAGEKGWQASGLEVSPYASAQARARGLDVQCGDTLQPFADRQFDLITMWDVIEHLNDPLQMLRDVHELLAPGGMLVVSTGDVGHLFSRLLRRHARMYAPPQHLYYFTRSTLTRLLSRAGYVVESIRPDKKVVNLHYVLYVARGLVDNPLLERTVDWLVKRLPDRPVRLTLWDVMIVSARRL